MPKLSLSGQVLLALVLGIAAGIFFGEAAASIEIAGTASSPADYPAFLVTGLFTFFGSTRRPLRRQSSVRGRPANLEGMR